MAVSRVVIDTDLLIDFLRNKSEARTLVAEMEKEFQIATTVVNVYELFFGAHKSSHKEKSLRSTRVLLRRLQILPLTPRAAQTAGNIMAVLEAEGQQIGLGDVLIAAIAITKGFAVATSNSDHFGRIDGLNLIKTGRAGE